MKRGFLDKLGIINRPETWGNKNSQKKYNKQREKYGFDEREIYDLDYTFALWLYERVSMYYKIASKYVKLDEPDRITYNSKLYSQENLIKLLLEKLEVLLVADKHSALSFEEEEELYKSIGEIWTVLLPYMWW